MPDTPERGSRNPANESCDRASALARRRMSDAASYAAADATDAHAANDVRPGTFSRQTVADLIADLHAAVLSTDRGACKPVIARMIGAGIDNHEIADIHVPAVARLLGETWCADRIGFAAVTIGVARLQMMLRDLGAEWRADVNSDPDTPAILVVVASEVNHMLGAVILSGQLRRRGFSVRLIMGARAEDVGMAMRMSHYDAVMMSAACGDSIDLLRRLVDAVRLAQRARVPVVIGGTILDGTARVPALTGADHATSDLDEALQLCKLRVPAHGMAQTARRV